MVNIDEYIKSNKMLSGFLVILVGLLAGAVNGFLGTGGGIILVPAMAYLFGMEQKKSQATAMVIVLPLCVLSGIVYTIGGVADWATLLPVCIGVVVGGVLGAILLKKLSNNVSAFIFYGLMLFGGIKLLIK